MAGAENERRAKEEEAHRQGKAPVTVILCAGCQVRNRVPAERLGRLHTLRCARCHQPLGPPP